MIGLDLDGLAVDGCHTKVPCKGEKAGPSPVDRAKQGLKRSPCTDAKGVPLGIASAGANRHDSRLLDPTLHTARTQVGDLPENVTVHLDSVYNGKPRRTVLDQHRLFGEIAARGVPAPIQVGRLRVIESTQS
jgi:Transposase DDE domain